MSETSPTSRTLNGRLIPLPGVYTFDPAHTFAEFSAQHLVIGHVRGRFDKTTGKVTITEDPTLSFLEVTIETASISTHNALRDEDLRSPRFFDVAKFPTMTYRSTAFVPELEGRWKVEGELTIREIAFPIPLSVQISGIIVDSRGNIRVGIHTYAQANRKDFGLLADLEQENGGMMFGKDVVITVDTEVLLPK